MKAIETEYNGYRFRSRLEARWAVFFDTLDARYEYEPEGYDLGEYGWYLPDFWIPILDCWVEVKPSGSLYSTEKIYNQLRTFGNEMGPIICTSGPPTSGHYDCHILCGDITDSSGGHFEDWCKFVWCDICKRISVRVRDTRLDRDRVLFRSGNLLQDAWIHHCRHPYDLVKTDLAINAARSARFEHGESP